MVTVSSSSGLLLQQNMEMLMTLFDIFKTSFSYKLNTQIKIPLIIGNLYPADLIRAISSVEKRESISK